MRAMFEVVMNTIPYGLQDLSFGPSVVVIHQLFVWGHSPASFYLAFYLLYNIYDFASIYIFMLGVTQLK